MHRNTLTARMRQAAAETGESFTDRHEPSFWLRTRLADLRTRVRSGQLAVCPHLVPGMIALVALWAPDRAVCGACAPTLRLTGDADSTCDRCGTVALMHQCLAAPTGSLVVVLGLCRTCVDREAGQ